MVFSSFLRSPWCLTALALFAFAGNSILCRLALGPKEIDALSFTLLRMFSGAVTLALLVFWRRSRALHTQRQSGVFLLGSWKDAFYLFVYAITFSFSYLTLDTGVGALVLFGLVQITMISSGVLAGVLPGKWEWSGLLLALFGLAFLLLPGAASPPIGGLLWMGISGIAWGLYSLSGRKATNALSATCGNFIKVLPFLMIFSVFAVFEGSYSAKLIEQISMAGVILAILSGALASGAGYAIWYAALAHLSTTRAAVLQLLVPVIAAFGGVLFSNETISYRLLIASLLVLGGVLMAILGRSAKTDSLKST